MTIKEWFKNYCQDYSIGGSAYLGDVEQKPTLLLFLYNFYRKLRGFAPIYRLRMLVQTLFRKNHIADNKLWEADQTMSERILPVLHAFKKMERNGHPSLYSEYDKAIASGDLVGGGSERWEADLDHMIKAVEFVAWESSKKIHQWYIDNFGIDPYSDDKRNEYKYYTYKTKNGSHGMTFGNLNGLINSEISEVEEHITHGNSELLNYINEYVHSGLELLGKRWRAFWD
jgi:hypothetical protein